MAKEKNLDNLSADDIIMSGSPSVAQEDTGWGVPGVPQYKLLDDDDSSAKHGPLIHTRSLPLPLRVKSGKITPDKLIISTASEDIEIPWVKIKFISLGMVAEKSEVDAKPFQFQKIMTGLLKGHEAAKDDKIVSFREVNLLDFFADGMDEPIRIDSSNVNYKAFLGKMSYSSFQNFFRLVHDITVNCKEARFTENVRNFLLWKKDKVKKYPALHEYEDEFMNCYNRLDKMLTWDQIDFTRNAWQQEEWTD